MNTWDFKVVRQIYLHPLCFWEQDGMYRSSLRLVKSLVKEEVKRKCSN